MTMQFLRVFHEKALHSTGNPTGARGGIQKSSGEVFLASLLSSSASRQQGVTWRAIF